MGIQMSDMDLYKERGNTLQSLNIVELSKIEKQHWLELWRAYQTFYQVDLDPAVSDFTWERLTSADVPEMYGFAACVNQEVVGIVHVVEHQSCWTMKPYAYLQDLFTQPQCRGQGIGKALIEAVYQHTQARQCDRVYWLTHQENHTAQIVYDQVARKTGFIQYRLNVPV